MVVPADVGRVVFDENGKAVGETREVVGYRAQCQCGWMRRVLLGEKWPSTGQPITSIDMVRAWAQSAAIVHRLGAS